MRERLINVFALDFEELIVPLFKQFVSSRFQVIVHVSAISLFTLDSKVSCELCLTNVIDLEIAQLIFFFFFFLGAMCLL